MADDVERCDSCDGLNFAWYADSRLWNEVIGGDPDREAAGLLCPACFAERADLHFAGSEWQVAGWRLIPDVRRVLTTHDGKGENTAPESVHIGPKDAVQ